VICSSKRKRKLAVQPLCETVKRKKYALSKAAIDIVKNDQWLEDIHMGVANQLLRRQFPDLAGLQPPVHRQDLSFTVVKDFFVHIYMDNSGWEFLEYSAHL
jgi:hypothetical protein